VAHASERRTSQQYPVDPSEPDTPPPVPERECADEPPGNIEGAAPVHVADLDLDSLPPVASFEDDIAREVLARASARLLLARHDPWPEPGTPPIQTP
jgi:hypothetical protein